MKELKIKLIVLFITISGVFLLFSCEKEQLTPGIETQINDVSYTKGIPDYSHIGHGHNMALRHSYTEIKEVFNNNSNISRSELFEEVADILHDFYSTSDVTKVDVDMADSISNNYLYSLKDYYANDSVNNNDDFIDSCINYGNFTLTQKQLLTELVNKVDTATSLNSVYAITSTISNKAMSQIADTIERTVILMGTSVMDSSCTYWYHNCSDWDEMFSNAAKGAGGWFDWNSIGKTDAIGASGGAVAGAITGAFVGGVGALPGAGIGALSGGAGGSTGDAVGQLWDHWF
ncbi:MAG: hypothetical protein PF448_06405 [Bacteroidales bacterium]|jgi:hypothetical protein|nr:hypothetical protein [Bacteroidales bacterium]